MSLMETEPTTVALVLTPCKWNLAKAGAARQRAAIACPAVTTVNCDDAYALVAMPFVRRPLRR